MRGAVLGLPTQRASGSLLHEGRLKSSRTQAARQIRCSGTVRERVRKPTEQPKAPEPFSLEDWDTLRRRQQRLQLAGEARIVPFRRRLRQPEGEQQSSQPAESQQTAVIEPELIPDSNVEVLLPKSDQASGLEQWQLVVGYSALLAMICSVDRAAMSVALTPMGDEFAWSDSVKGTISSSFFVGYTLTNLLGGYAATRFNPKQVLAAGALIWSVFTIATPAMAGNLPGLLATRAAMGIGEGVTFPAISNLFAKWVPQGKLSGSLGVAFSGGPIGIIAALLLAPPLIGNLGWQSVFWIIGSAGLIWTAVWLPTIADQPPALPAAAASGVAVAEAEKAEVEVVKVPAEEVIKLSDVPWGKFARNRSLLALLWCHCSHNMGPLICLSWMPSYYAQEFGLDVGHSAALSVLPWGLNVVLTNVAGYVGDKMVHQWKVDRTLARKVMQALGSLGPAACLFALASDQGEGHGMIMSVGLLSATLALGGFQAAGIGSNHQDIAPRWAGILFGVTNGLASVVGIGGIIGTGFILDATHSWGLVFGLAAGVYTLGYAGFAAFGSAEKQFD